MCGGGTGRGVTVWGIWRVLIGGSGAVFLFFAGPGALAAPAVVINEIMWDGTEYIELYNTTDAPITLTDWTITRQQAGGPAKIAVTFSDEDSIEAQGYFLVEKTDESTEQEAQKVVASLTLVNTGELVTLLDGSGSTVDVANQLDDWFAGANNDAGSSMERTDVALPGTVADNWHTATEVHFGRSGTPGTANSIPPLNAVPTAAISGDSEGVVGQLLAFSAEDSDDPDGDELTYTWQFGDGAVADGAEVSHSYTGAGTHHVTVTVADQESTAAASLAVAVTVPDYDNDVVVNEVLPNPTGPDTASEFIELYNQDGSTVDLAGWKLDDGEGGSTPYLLPEGSVIGAKSYAVYYRGHTKLALNNDTDAARLLDPTGTVQSQLAYSESVPEGMSYNRTDGGGATSTTTTPGAANVITQLAEEEEEDEEDENAASGKIAGASVTVVPLSALRDAEVGSLVQTEGVVSVPPGVVNTRWFYVAGSGVQVYLYSAAFPEIKLGDRLRVTGEITSYQNEARLKLTGPSDIQTLAAGPPPMPHRLETGEVGEEWEGSLVVVQGEVTRTSGDTFYIDDGSGEIRIFITEAAKITKPKMRTGMAVTITGVVSETKAGYRVLPRFQEDIRMGLVAGLTSFPATGRSVLFLVVSGGIALTLLTRAHAAGEPLVHFLH